MDTSISKALIMVAGILLAMIIIGFATYTFQHLSSWSTTKEDEYETQEAQKFNKEYEAYQKDLMYGVDVISCLNKAKSNNLKVDSGIYDQAYVVTVHVTFKTLLSESIHVYYINEKTKKESEAYNSTDFSQTPSRNLKELFKISDDYINWMKDYSQITYASTTLASISKELNKMQKNYAYQLGRFKAGVEPKTDDLMKALLEISNNLKQVEKNDTWNLTNNTWTRAVWETPLYSMKTKKFKCTGISYNAQTGRVNEINFEEF